VKLTSQDLEGNEKEEERATEKEKGRRGKKGGDQSLRGGQQPSVFENSKPESGRHVHVVGHLQQE